MVVVVAGVVVAGVIVVVVVVVAGVVVGVAVSDPHALRSEKDMALRSNAVRGDIGEFYHRFSERDKAEPKMKTPREILVTALTGNPL